MKTSDKQHDRGGGSGVFTSSHGGGSDVITAARRVVQAVGRGGRYGSISKTGAVDLPTTNQLTAENIRKLIFDLSGNTLYIVVGHPKSAFDELPKDMAAYEAEKDAMVQSSRLYTPPKDDTVITSSDYDDSPFDLGWKHK